MKEVEDVGHTHVSLEKLASRLGVTRPALYRHFADREALLAAVALHGFMRFQKAMEAGFRSDPDPWKALHASGCAYVRFAMKNPGWFRLQFSRGQTEKQDSLLATRRSEFGPLMYMALADRFGQENPELNDLFRILWAQAHGLAVFVVERVFRLVKTDAERMAAAENALRCCWKPSMPIPLPRWNAWGLAIGARPFRGYPRC